MMDPAQLSALSQEIEDLPFGRRLTVIVAEIDTTITHGEAQPTYPDYMVILCAGDQTVALSLEAWRAAAESVATTLLSITPIPAINQAQQIAADAWTHHDDQDQDRERLS